jgi:hypothetical protein
MALAACSGNLSTDDDLATDYVAQSSEALLTVDADAVRFLEQASFGPTPADVALIAAHGGSANGGLTWWLQDQIANHPLITQYDASEDCGPFRAAVTCLRDQFFDHAIHAPDQLRQRVAFALSEILVTSLVKLGNDVRMVDYVNILLKNALGDFGTLLKDVAESPAMGYYLDNANNNATAPTDAPNENFARELMQLFSIGLCQLNQNGTPVLQADGTCVPSYIQKDVEAHAHLMTGWKFSNLNGCGSAGAKPGLASADFSAPLIACDKSHDPTANPLLTPGYQTAPAWKTREVMEDADDGAKHSGVIWELTHHPNTAPFIGKQLIQRLVTGSPSAAYVARVAAVFTKDPITGKTGQLDAVVTAILTDPEARDTTPGGRAGRLREPALFITNLTRLLGLSDTTGLITMSGRTRIAGVVSPGKKLKSTGACTDDTKCGGGTCNTISHTCACAGDADCGPGDVCSTKTHVCLDWIGTSGGGLRDASADMGQDVFFSPSVFNYFPPDYQVPTTLTSPRCTTATVATDCASAQVCTAGYCTTPPGAACVAAADCGILQACTKGHCASSPLIEPELDIEDTYTVVARANFVDKLLHSTAKDMLPQPIDLTPLNLPTTVTGMLDWCNAYMMHNAMPAVMYNTIKPALAIVPVTGTAAEPGPIAMQKRAIYLVATSSQYQVAR